MAQRILDSFEYFGKCLELTTDKIRLVVTLDVGPRIVYFGDSEHNIFFHDVENHIMQQGAFFDDNFKKGEFWKIYGGHRLWKSPEDWASYAPDNYPVELRVIDTNHVTVRATPEKLTGVQKIMDIEVTDSDRVRVTHIFKNVTSAPVSYSLWALSVLKAGGVAISPVGHQNTGLLPNRNFVYWSYARESDPRYNVRQNYLTLTQDTQCESPFKVGLFNPYGKAGYYVDGGLFTKSFSAMTDKNYPDWNCNLEMYTCADMLELESLSPLTTIEADATYSHTELWRYQRAESASVDELYEMIMD